MRLFRTTRISALRKNAFSTSKLRFLSSTATTSEAPKQEEKQQQQQQGPKKSRAKLYLLAAALFGYAGYLSSLSEGPDSSWEFLVLKSIPYRAISRVWGAVHNIELPTFLRAPLYNLWTVVFDCKLDEMLDPIESYPNLAAFFVRQLKPDARKIDQQADLVSPVDARVMAFGPVGTDGRVEQVKGMPYSIHDFLGPKLLDQPTPIPSSESPDPSKLYYVSLYLAPGDYHRIHSAADCCLTVRRHVPGDLFPVAPKVAELVPGLFVRNERVVLSGYWPHGYFSLSPIGALNVGSIAVTVDPVVKTNVPGQTITSVEPYGPNQGGLIKQFEGKPFEVVTPSDGWVGVLQQQQGYPAGLCVRKGTELARFHLGSSVVIVFEARDGEFEFDPSLKVGEKVKLGQPFGVVKKKKTKTIVQEEQQGRSWFWWLGF